jgi:hypothetical protein
MSSEHLPNAVLRLAPAKAEHGTWCPASVTDCVLLRATGWMPWAFVLGRPDGYSVSDLVNHCARRNVAVIFDPSLGLVEPPSPTPDRGRGTRPE